MTAQNTSAVNKPEAAIQQLNLSYNAEQDRLLLLRVGLADNSELLVGLAYLPHYQADLAIAEWQNAYSNRDIHSGENAATTGCRTV